jgi:sporulation protein YlmC with PRC-barrel domain
MGFITIFSPNKRRTLAAQVTRGQWKTAAVAEWLGTVEQYWAGKGRQACTTAHPEGPRVIKASDVVGMDIQTDSGSHLGTIRELTLDDERGVVASVVVVRKGPSFALQRTFFTLPWTKLHLNIGHHTIVVHLGARTDL